MSNIVSLEHFKRTKNMTPGQRITLLEEVVKEEVEHLQKQVDTLKEAILRLRKENDK